QEDRRAERQEGQEQAGSRRAASAGHSRLQEIEWSEPPDYHLVRLDRDFYRTERGSPERESARKGNEGERRKHRPFDGVCLRLADGGRAVCEWRSEFDRRYSGDDRTRTRARSPHLRQGL